MRAQGSASGDLETPPRSLAATRRPPFRLTIVGVFRGDGVPGVSSKTIWLGARGRIAPGADVSDARKIDRAPGTGEQPSATSKGKVVRKRNGGVIKQGSLKGHGVDQDIRSRMSIERDPEVSSCGKAGTVLECVRGRDD